MLRQEIIEKLVLNHQEFITCVLNLRDEEYTFSLNNEKWTPGQHADHILRSVSPVRKLFAIPVWLGKLVFRKANRPSRTYDKLIERYLQRLGQGGKASGRFVPGKVTSEQRQTLAMKIQSTVKKLCRGINRYSEQDLDSLVLPHPLLGWLTLREMLYFTIYHVDHHRRLALRDLANR